MGWEDVAKTFGLPTLILAALAWFGLRHIWPFITKQVESAQEEGRKERLAFLEALERRDRELQKIVDQLLTLNDLIRHLRGDIKSRPIPPLPPQQQNKP